jgi:hypothetical protein
MRVSCCKVVILQGLKLVRITVTLSDMSDSCLLLSSHSNSTFIMLYMYREMDVDMKQWHDKGELKIKIFLELKNRKEIEK